MSPQRVAAKMKLQIVTTSKANSRYSTGELLMSEVQGNGGMLLTYVGSILFQEHIPLCQVLEQVPTVTELCNDVEVVGVFISAIHLDYLVRVRKTFKHLCQGKESDTQKDPNNIHHDRLRGCEKPLHCHMAKLPV
jgi:hypothetical protein